ncbi:MAG: tRNA uridine-5-carboxymethylaminomethyl(34) synthesis GTPase MnmE, partial [Proteobacteria bacterium]|nr:tRNA uridine-5-carboxymethylaminomethyl(34) synthesis GTPase MnmE [Pseudomonadota bacterium]
AAIATPKGIGGIGIIRISGPLCIAVANDIFRKKDLKAPSLLTPRKLYNGYIIDNEESVIDEVLLAYMKGPNSYTAEDVIEIQAHAGFYTLKSILELVFSKGVVPAQPGEFTKRAFLNGRIDLTQAEAVIDMINAKTKKSLKIALSQIKGNISLDVTNLRGKIENILTQFEAVLDFPEDVGDIIDTENLIETIEKDIQKPLQSLLDNYENGHILRDGVKLAIVGVPNAGKSSLMNRLLNKERSIVTHIPGTTRDVIEEPLNLNGVEVVVSDTAGIHETSDPVEKIGIERTEDAIDSSDIVLFLVDGTTSYSKNDKLIAEKIGDKKAVLVVNKSDLTTENSYDVTGFVKDLPSVYISAKQGDGLSGLKGLINDLVISDLTESDDTAIPNIRHKEAIDKSITSLELVVDGLLSELPFEMVSMDLRDAHGFLGEILGITERVDILDNIFSDFCIGK